MAGTSIALPTDRYELTMREPALARGASHRRSGFEVFARRLPEGRRYRVVPGTRRLLESQDKQSVSGQKWVVRRRSPDEVAEAEVLEVDRAAAPDTNDHDLLFLQGGPCIPTIYEEG